MESILCVGELEMKVEQKGYLNIESVLENSEKEKVGEARPKAGPLLQLDVNNAFLHGDLDEEVFIKLLHGYSVPSSFGFDQLGYGVSLVILVVYVDDTVITGVDSSEISVVKSFLHAQFKIKDLGCLNYFMGIEVHYSDFGVFLHQRKFILDLLANFHCSYIFPVLCPLELSAKLKAHEGDPLPKPDVYRSLIEKLNFLTHTRPDICFAIQHLSQFMQPPCLPHMQAVFHVLRYLKGTSDCGIFFNNSSDLSLTTYCDSDWAACLDTRRSKSKKQPVVSMSSAEAKYKAMSKAVTELAWLSRLLSDLGLQSSSPIPLFCDSQATIHISKNPVFHERTKHIELDCYLVRAKLAEGLIHLLHTSSSTQLDDTFTKALGGAAHHGFLSKLGVLSPSNLRGC
ncbi:uncharacterized mitochondrial protein AtMg00810-like [Nicotiana sylvestris]|uniref:uncharacterized mitochondrial protein AtMg00810-like n=1 Tax=Nicotiana sylvestris TaxID=4096 RepID=UPI00388CCB48